MLRKLLTLLLLAGVILIGCRQEDNPPATVGVTPGVPAATASPAAGEDAVATPQASATPQPTPTITPTPLPPKDLIVCMGSEPADLYLYGDDSPAATAVRHALYDSPVTSLAYTYQGLALEKLPSLEEGDAQLEAVEVAEGDLVITATGELSTLGQGTEVVDATGQSVVYNGQPLSMNRLVVDFTFKPLVWSDGTPVTAEDSVFSFRLAGHRGAPTADPRMPYTAGYEASGERSVRWTGLPGHLDPAYVTYVWTPLPAHQLSELPEAEVPAAEEAARAPLSYGAFVLDTWTPGESIRLVPNPHYYRAAEGLPHLTSLTYRFLEPNQAALPADYEGCHVLTSDLLSFDSLPAIEEQLAAGSLVEHTAAAGVVEQIVFGIDSTAAYSETHVNWFQDARVRQALTLCTNRQGLVDELTYGRGAVMDSYVAADHALHPDDLAQWAYDPAAGNALLDELGYVDTTGDGIRNNIASTVPFSVTLGTNAESLQRQRINERVRDDLAGCGIQVSPYTQEAGAWYAPGPVGVVFGRKFDLATFAWLQRIHPNCALYLTANIPGSLELGYNGWSGVNISGWSNETYDAACGRALSLLPGQAGYAEAHQEAMRLFAQELPAMPLFTRLRLATTTPDVLNFRLDPTQPSELWNAFELDLSVGGAGNG